jgi:hypothetical protein
MNLTPERQAQYDAHQEWLKNYSNGARLDWCGADLRCADLSGADLSRSDLSRSDLSHAKGILRFGPYGSRGDDTYAVVWPDTWMIKCGCRWCTLAKFAEAVNHDYPAADNRFGIQYRALIVMLETLWPLYREGK